MFCSHCGRLLGQTAHIVNDQLLCDDCFAKLGETHGASSPNIVGVQQPVSIGQVDEQDRKAISDLMLPRQQTSLQVEDPPATAQNTAQPLAKMASSDANKVELAPSEEGTLLSKFLLPGESILWKRSFSKGILNRHLTCTEVVTNLRAAVIDDEKLSILRYAQLRNCEVTVDNQHRSYSGVHSGYSRYGGYSGTSVGQSVTYGNVNFIQNGNVLLTLYNVSDPHGLKSLISATRKSMD